MKSLRLKPKTYVILLYTLLGLVFLTVLFVDAAKAV